MKGTCPKVNNMFGLKTFDKPTILKSGICNSYIGCCNYEEQQNLINDWNSKYKRQQLWSWSGSHLGEWINLMSTDFSYDSIALNCKGDPMPDKLESLFTGSSTENFEAILKGRRKDRNENSIGKKSKLEDNRLLQKAKNTQTPKPASTTNSPSTKKTTSNPKTAQTPKLASTTKLPSTKKTTSTPKTTSTTKSEDNSSKQPKGFTNIYETKEYNGKTYVSFIRKAQKKNKRKYFQAGLYSEDQHMYDHNDYDWDQITQNTRCSGSLSKLMKMGQICSHGSIAYISNVKSCRKKLFDLRFNFLCTSCDPSHGDKINSDGSFQFNESYFKNNNLNDCIEANVYEKFCLKEQAELMVDFQYENNQIEEKSKNIIKEMLPKNFEHKELEEKCLNPE